MRILIVLLVLLAASYVAGKQIVSSVPRKAPAPTKPVPKILSPEEEMKARAAELNIEFSGQSDQNNIWGSTHLKLVDSPKNMIMLSSNLTLINCTHTTLINVRDHILQDLYYDVILGHVHFDPDAAAREAESQAESESELGEDYDDLNEDPFGGARDR
jgi:hypothetical protein